MACTVNTLTLVKDKDFGIKLESATPAVDLPVGGVDGREVEKDGLCPLHHYNSVHSCHASSFISFNNNI